MGTGTNRRASELAALALSALWLLGAEAGPPAAEPVRLGASEAALRARFGETLREVSVQPVRSLHERVREAESVSEPPATTYREQRRLARSAPDPDRVEAEYDVFRGRVYRVRWRLAERFERPIMETAVAHLTKRLGPPAFDQTLRAKLGSGKADLRRAGWLRDGIALELRQLSPLTGGPTYLTLGDVSALEAIVAAETLALPQPESSPPWWQGRQRPPALLTALERDHLRTALDALVARIGFAPAPEAG